jgi:uncharacterized membrane protein
MFFFKKKTIRKIFARDNKHSKSATYSYPTTFHHHPRSCCLTAIVIAKSLKHNTPVSHHYTNPRGAVA